MNPVEETKNTSVVSVPKSTTGSPILFDIKFLTTSLEDTCANLVRKSSLTRQTFKDTSAHNTSEPDVMLALSVEKLLQHHQD